MYLLELKCPVLLDTWDVTIGDMAEARSGPGDLGLMALLRLCLQLSKTY